MIKAVIFDMYETLVTLHASPNYFGAQIAADANIPTDDFYKIWRDPEVDKKRTIGKLTLEQTVEKILRANNRYSDALFSFIIEKRIRLGSDAFSHLHPDILPMLTALKAHDIKIGLISNCYSEEAANIRQSVLFPYFDVPCLSYEEGLCKPDTALFERCLARLGVAAAECLYVGDGGSHELETAKKLGMKAVQALWYLKDNVGQPCMRKSEFIGAKEPMELLSML